jgi:large subunit ribosomal protein L4
MKKQTVINNKGEKLKDITLKESIFGIEPNNAVLYDALVLTRNSQRQGTADTKTRSDVSGGGKKPWKQKGTGRARAGSTRSPLWRHGGVAFGPHPREYDKKMNKKERRLALKSALAHKFKDGDLIVIDDIKLTSNKTKEIVKLLKDLKIEKKTLIVLTFSTFTLKIFSTACFIWVLLALTSTLKVTVLCF